MKKHTKGNWFAHDGQIYPEETGKTLALIPYFDKENEEQQANAYLIAAAPDLLEACQLALSLIRETFPFEHGRENVGLAWGSLEDAINKAQGYD